MANIKFSQFTQKTTLGTVDFLVGYTGADNVQIDPADLLSDYSQGTGAAGQVTFFSATSTVTGDNDFYWDNTNKRLGIGTTSPTRNLVVSGVGSSASTYIKILGDTSQEAILELHADNDAPGDRWRIAASNSSKLQIRSNGSNVLSVTSSENVGIGTTNPSAKLHVDGTLIATGVSQLGSGGSNVYLTSSSAGSVGIGTSSPAYKLDVTGDSSSGVIAVRNLANGRDTFRSENASGVRTVNIGNDANGHGLVLVRGTGGTVTNYITGNGNSYFNAGNVGIGTSSPGQKLEVYGTIKARTVANGAVGELKLGNLSNLLADNGDLSIRNNTTSLVKVTSAGNVGIGTATPGNKLHVSGGEIQVVNGSFGKLLLQNSTNYVYGDQNGVVIFNANDNLRLYTVGSEKMRIDSSGNVGIGTTNPTEKLQVNSGDILINNSTISSLKSGGSLYIDLNTFGSYSGRNFRISDNGTSLVNVKQTGEVGIGTTSPGVPLDVVGLIRTTTSFVGNACIVNSLTSATSGGSIFFKNNSGVNLATLTDNGNVGIGTTSPTHKLHVAGTTAHTTVKVSTTTHNANFEVKTDNSNFALIGQGSSNRFDIWDTNAGATRLSVNSSGNVGIGSTNPSYKLDVVGSAGNTARFKGSGGQATVSINDGTNDNYIVALSGDLQLRPSGTTVLTTKSSGNVGIGSTSPTSKLTVAVGDIETSGVGYGIILKSPDGTRYRVTVANGGTLSVSAV